MTRTLAEEKKETRERERGEEEQEEQEEQEEEKRKKRYVSVYNFKPIFRFLLTLL